MHELPGAAQPVNLEERRGTGGDGRFDGLADQRRQCHRVAAGGRSQGDGDLTVTV
jgi:hypothetical protein